MEPWRWCRRLQTASHLQGLDSIGGMQMTAASTASSLAVIITLLFPLQGSTDTLTLERYASELAIASTPGPSVERFVGRTAGDPPDRRLAILYAEIFRQWEYVADPPGRDHFQSAEPLFFRGDCEDFAAVMLAV